MKTKILHIGLLLTLGVFLTGALTAQNMSRYITLFVGQGQGIALSFAADANNTPIKIVSGIQEYNITADTSWTDFTNYTAGSITMTIYGDIKKFSCFNNGTKLEGLNISQNTALKELTCSYNNLSSLNVSNHTALEVLHCSTNPNLNSLDASGCTALKEFWCFSNPNLSSLDASGCTALEGLGCNNNANLSSLNVSGCTALKGLACFGNPFSTNAVDELFCALPDREMDDSAKVYILNNTSDANYANVIASNKQNATNKNWKVWYFDNNSGSLHNTNIPATTGNYECGAETYKLYIAGVQVTSENASDLSVINGVSGTVNYNDATKTLTLENVTINLSVANTEVLRNEIPGLKIKLIGSNNLSAINRPCLASIVDVQIEGSGSLVANSQYRTIYIRNAALTIKDCHIEANGTSGITGYNGQSVEDLTINNASVVATGTNASIKNINSLTLNGCYITAPVGAAFDEDLKGVALNGSLVTGQVVIEPDNGIEDSEKLGVSIYPNPAVDIIEISIDDANIKGLELQVYDVLGKLIIQQAITDQTTQLNIKNLQKGVYILKVGNNTQRFVKR